KIALGCPCAVMLLPWGGTGTSAQRFGTPRAPDTSQARTPPGLRRRTFFRGSRAAPRRVATAPTPPPTTPPSEAAARNVRTATGRRTRPRRHSGQNTLRRLLLTASAPSLHPAQLLEA